jgi:hypothetical protein
MTREAEYLYQHPDYAPQQLSAVSALGGFSLWVAGLVGLAVLCFA